MTHGPGARSSTAACSRREWASDCSASSGCWRWGWRASDLYGILAYSVNQRKREIGLRMALGAAQASVLRLILKQGMSLVLTGVLIGFVGGAGCRTLAEQNAVRRQRERSDQCRRGGIGVVGRRAAGVLSAGALGQPRRSVGGVARRVTADTNTPRPKSCDCTHSLAGHSSIGGDRSCGRDPQNAATLRLLLLHRPGFRKRSMQDLRAIRC